MSQIDTGEVIVQDGFVAAKLALAERAGESSLAKNNGGTGGAVNELVVDSYNWLSSRINNCFKQEGNLAPVLIEPKSRTGCFLTALIAGIILTQTLSPLMAATALPSSLIIESTIRD